MGTSAVTQRTIDLEKLQHSVCLLSVSFTMGIGNMRQIANKVETTADQTRVRSQKKLLDVPELEEIRSQDAKLRRYLDLKTCTFREGQEFLPIALLPEVDRVLQAYMTIRRPALVQAFMDVYKAEYETGFAKTRAALGDVFNENDYPKPGFVEAGFNFNYSITTVESSEALKTIDAGIYEREAKKAQGVMLAAAEEWRDALRQAGADMVTALYDVLRPDPITGKRKKLYDTHLTHLEEYLETFNFRDITDDAEYRQHVTRLKDIMAGVKVEKLRESETLKDALAGKLDGVKQQLSTLVITSGRKFR